MTSHTITERSGPEIIGTPLAGLSYVFLSFCSFTDGSLEKDELKAAGQEIAKYTKAWEWSDEDANQAITDAFTMLDGCETYEQEKDLFIAILNVLKQQEWWNQGNCEFLVEGLTRMMNADNEQSEGELFWLNHIKEGWKVS